MNFLTNFFKGIVISISQIVPGVSGGTIAIVLGIYDKLLHAINNILKDFKNQYKILLQVGTGALVGIFLLSNIVKSLLEKYPIPLGYLFIGIILGGAPLMYRKATIRGFKKSSIIYLVIGVIIVSLMTRDFVGTSEIITSLSIKNFLWLFVGGIIVAIALILPGISGSFMLLVLGLYDTVITAVTTVNISILAPIALGGIFGTLAIARIIEILLNKYSEPTYMMIFGFILASVYGVFPGFDGINSIIGIILGILGFIFVIFISRKELNN
jgi:putative membrane protein